MDAARIYCWRFVSRIAAHDVGFRDIIESIFIDGLTEKEYLDYLRRTERRKYSASKWYVYTKSVPANSARAS